jgi:DNA polymerase-3 subunit alpha
LKAKAAVKDIARVLGRSPSDGDMITKLIPADPKMTLRHAVADPAELKALIEGEPWVKEVFDEAFALEGLNRNVGIHAAGVIIGDQRLDNVVPLSRGAHEEVVAQFVAGFCESLGLLKMDFLGLRTLTVIQDAIDNIKKSRGFELDWAKVPSTTRRPTNCSPRATRSRSSSWSPPASRTSAASSAWRPSSTS